MRYCSHFATLSPAVTLCPPHEPMNLRPALYDLAYRHSLDRPALDRLFQWAGFDDEPPNMQRWFWRCIALVAAALGGFGIVLWIAANWQSMGRTGHFALLQVLAVAGCLGAWRWPAARAAFGLLALLGIGALFAYFGQTYQTGADAWQLFALWAVLALPLCLAVRSDVLWSPWALVAMTAVTLWLLAHASGGWRFNSATSGIALTADAVALLLTALLSPAGPRWIGGGLWAHRTAGTLTVILISATAIKALFFASVAAPYGLGLGLLTACAVPLAQRRYFDIYLLSAVGLALNAVLVAGLTRQLLTHRDDFTVSVLMIGLAAAGLLAASVSGILHLARKHNAAMPTSEPT